MRLKLLSFLRSILRIYVSGSVRSFIKNGRNPLKDQYLCVIPVLYVRNYYRDWRAAQASFLQLKPDMISLLTGTVAEVTGSMVTLDVNGVGYEVIASRNCASRLEAGGRAKIVIYTDVKQDSIRLFGFDDQLEKQVFLLLTRVKGIGTRTASEIVSKIDKKDLLKVIGAGNLTALSAVKGIGKKTAERIIVELKDKVGEYALERGGGAFEVEVEVLEPAGEAIEALLALGFSRKDAEGAVSQVGQQADLSSLPSGEIVRQALRFV